MIKSCRIKNFRGFSDLSLGSLEPVNLLIGKNNVGKTAVLEAIFLLLGCTNPELSLRINVFRGLTVIGIDSLSWLFYNKIINSQIAIICTDSKQVSHELSIQFTSPDKSEINITNTPQLIPDNSGSFTTTLGKKILELTYSNDSKKPLKFNTHINMGGEKIEFKSYETSPFEAGVFFASSRPVSIQENAERLSKITSLKQDKEIIDVLKEIIEPKLERLIVTVGQGNAGIVADLGQQYLMPINFMGDGMNRLLSILLAIRSSPGGYVLIDEIENGFHYSILPKVWEAIGKLAKTLNTQIFATTHSLECAVAAHEVFKKSESYDFQLSRLERVDDQIKVINFDKDDLDIAIKQNWEVR